MGAKEKIYILPDGQTISVTILKRMNKLSKKSLFPKQLAEANRILSTSILPER